MVPVGLFETPSPVAKPIPPELVEWLERMVVRGGPGSGHRGHKGRPGKVGGSQPGRGLRYSYTPENSYKSVDADSLEEAIANGRGNIYVTTTDGQLWALFSYPREDEVADREFTLDDIDFQKEIDTAVSVYDYFIDLMADPENAKAFAAGDRSGQSMLNFTQRFLEDWERIKANRGDYLETTVRGYSASLNIIMVNDRTRAGAGSSTVGTRSAKVFWVPVSLDPEKSVLTDDYGAFVLSPVYVLSHELHHGFGSGSELDVFSTAVAADYYLSHPDTMTPSIEMALVREVSGNMNSGAERAAGNLREPKLYNRAMMGWLYSRHTDYFDDLFAERRAYEGGEIEDLSERAYAFLVWKGTERLQNKVEAWAKEFGTS